MPARTSSVSIWTSQLELNAESSGCAYHRANIYRNGRLACKVCLTGPFPTREAALDALSVKLDRWIEAFESRENLAALRMTDAHLRPETP